MLTKPYLRSPPLCVHFLLKRDNILDAIHYVVYIKLATSVRISGLGLLQVVVWNECNAFNHYGRAIGV